VKENAQVVHADGEFTFRGARFPAYIEQLAKKRQSLTVLAQRTLQIGEVIHRCQGLFVLATEGSGPGLQAAIVEIHRFTIPATVVYSGRVSVQRVKRVRVLRPQDA